MLLKIKQMRLKISDFLKNLFELTVYLIPVLVFVMMLIVVIGVFYAG